VVSRFTHIILIACLSLASVFAPVVAGKVICRADGGHRAVEVAHDATGCAVVASLDDARGDGSKTPCDDQAVGDLETAVQGGKDTTPPHIPFACSSDLLPSAISQGGLSTIVLLI
jgi:hypothetical protein